MRTIRNKLKFLKQFTVDQRFALYIHAFCQTLLDIQNSKETVVRVQPLGELTIEIFFCH